MKRKKVKEIINKISVIFGFIFLISFGLFNAMVLYLDILPAKYLIVYLIVMGLIGFILFLFLFVKKFKKGIKIFSIILSFILSIIFGIGSFYINRTYDFMGKVGSKDKMTEEYYIIVNKDSKIKKIEDLKGKYIGVFDEGIEIYEKAKEELINKTSAKLIENDSIEQMAKSILNKKVDAIMMSATHKITIEDEIESFSSSTKIIATLRIEVENTDKVEASDLKIAKDVFTIYISGNDSYGDLLARGRSDVNMLATVNPKTHEILLVSIPRDYYVQLSGTTGYKDKLTHAGMYGVNMSILTLEDLLDIDIDYYIKVNFSTLIGVVDKIGGIDVYSDASFIPWTDGSVTIKKGTMHMDGKTALAFARERHAYLEGDRHRVQNQQDVLMAIIEKMTNSTTLLTKYTSILDYLSNSFETNISTKDLTSLIKMQIDKMPSWTFKSYNLNGSDSSNYTYSFGKQLLYVMEPDYTTVKTASNYINSMKDQESFEEIGIK